MHISDQRAESIKVLGRQFSDSWSVFRFKRTRGFGRRKLQASDLGMLACLDGLHPGMQTLTASNGPGRRNLVHHLLRGVKPVFAADPALQWLHVTLIVDGWATSDEQTVIDLATIHSQTSAILDAMAADWMAVVELQVFANVPHAAGGKRLSPHVHAVVWGHDIHTAACKLADDLNGQLSAGTLGADAVYVQLINPTWLDLAHVVRYPFKAPDRCKTLYIHRVTGDANLHESEKGDRFIRYLRIGRILSVIRQRDLVFGAGAGVALQAAALKAATARLRRRAARAGLAITVRDVRRFWAALHRPRDWQRFARPNVIRPAKLQP